LIPNEDAEEDFEDVEEDLNKSYEGDTQIDK
jgi:hypothetical protein